MNFLKLCIPAALLACVVAYLAFHEREAPPAPATERPTLSAPKPDRTKELGWESPAPVTRPDPSDEFTPDPLFKASLRSILSSKLSLSDEQANRFFRILDRYQAQAYDLERARAKISTDGNRITVVLPASPAEGQRILDGLYQDLAGEFGTELGEKIKNELPNLIENQFSYFSAYDEDIEVNRFSSTELRVIRSFYTPAGQPAPNGISERHDLSTLPRSALSNFRLGYLNAYLPSLK